MQDVRLLPAALGAMLVLSVALSNAHAQQRPDPEQYRRPAAIPFPSSNPYTPEKAALGKALFFEPRLSGGENLTCASCHNPSFGWEERTRTAIGSQNTRLPRHAPTILDTAWLKSFFWDGRAIDAEHQAKGPITAPAEMNLPLDQAVARLSAIPEYQARFARIFPDQGITGTTIVAAIATFERTVVSSYAPFDAWVDGDDRAVSPAAKRGFAIFTGKAHCSACHSGWSFTDGNFHDIGTSDTDIGRAAIDPSNILNRYAFKTPSLRDTALRAPYMHDGQYATLEEVVRHYENLPPNRPSRSPLLQPIHLSSAEITDIVAFLETLTGSKQAMSLPVLPN